MKPEAERGTPRQRIESGAFRRCFSVEQHKSVKSHKSIP